MSLSPAGVINGASFKDERCCLASQMAHFESPPSTTVLLPAVKKLVMRKLIM